MPVNLSTISSISEGPPIVHVLTMDLVRVNLYGLTYRTGVLQSDCLLEEHPLKLDPPEVHVLTRDLVWVTGLRSLTPVSVAAEPLAGNELVVRRGADRDLVIGVPGVDLGVGGTIIRGENIGDSVTVSRGRHAGSSNQGTGGSVPDHFRDREKPKGGAAHPGQIFQDL